MRGTFPRVRLALLSLVAGAAVVMAFRGQATAGSGTPEAGSLLDTVAVVVPFENVQDLVVLRASLGPVDSLNLILDTGVSSSVIGLAAAKERKLEIAPGPPLAVRGVGGSGQLAYPAVIEDLAISGTLMPAFDGVVMELAAMEGALGRRLDGALGYSFLQGRVVRIDYAAGQVTLYPLAEPVDEGTGSLPMQVDGGSILLDSVFLNGRALRVRLDTGAGPALTVAESAVGRLGLDDLRSRAVEGRVRGARGTAAVWHAQADSVRVGDVSVRDVPVGFASFVPQGDAILGSGFFQGLVLTLDYVSGIVHVAEGPDG